MADGVSVDASLEVYCPACGYSLRGLAGVVRCPECGLEADLSTQPVSRVPWAHRRKLGRVRAYLATVWVSTFRPGRILQDAAVPAPYADGRSFRLITVALMSVGLSGAAAAALLASLVGPRAKFVDAGMDFVILDLELWTGSALDDLILPLEAGLLWTWPVWPVLVFLWLWAATAIPQWFLRPTGVAMSRQNRAIAVSQYAVGPMAWMPLWGVAVAAIALVGSFTNPPDLVVRIAILLGSATFVWFLSALLVWWTTTWRLAFRVGDGNAGRGVLAAVGWPVLSVGVAIGLASGIWTIGLVRIMFTVWPS